MNTYWDSFLEKFSDINELPLEMILELFWHYLNKSFGEVVALKMAMVERASKLEVDSHSTSTNKASVPCCVCGELIVVNTEKYHCQKCFTKLTAQHT